MGKHPEPPGATSEPVVPAPEEIRAIIDGLHTDPFAVMGLHEIDGVFQVRCFIPGAESVEAETIGGKLIGTLERLDRDGFFAGKVEIAHRQPILYRARRGSSEWTVVDAYSFGPVLGPMDDYYIREGSHLRLFDKLGAHPMMLEGVSGFHFAVWAPNARRVSVVGSFNNWDGRMHVMRLRRDTGIWEIFVPDVPVGEAYKFEIVGPDGTVLPLKADPFARRSELRPQTASVTTGSCIRTGKTRHTGSTGLPSMPAASQFRSTRFMRGRGRNTRTGGSIRGTKWRII